MGTRMQYVSKISTEKSKYRPICKVGITSEINISGADRRNSYCCIYCLNMVKTCQTETELFEFSQYELKIKKKTMSFCNGFVASASLQWLLLLQFAYVKKQNYNFS